MGIIYTALTLFGMTAIIGIYLFTLFFRNKGIPKAATLIHMLFAVLGLLLLVLYCFTHQNGPWVSVVVFILAATAGFVLNFRDLTGKKIPKWLAILHGLVAILGFAFLLLFAIMK